MFATSYSNSPLVGTAANEIFPNIKGDTAALGDVTILAAMRVLLYDRLKDGQQAAFVQREVSPSSFTGDLTQALTAVFSGYDLENAENTLFVVNVQVNNDGEKKTLIDRFKGVKSLFGMGPNKAFEEGLFNKVMKSKVYMNAERSCTLIFVAGNMTSIASHAIAVLLPRYFDRFFDHDDKGHVLLSDNEDLLIKKGLSEDKRADSFISAVQRFAERFDFRTPEIKAKLDGFEKKYAKNKAQVLDRTIEDTIQKINDINTKYASLVRKKRSLLEQRTAIMLGLEEDKNENALMNYFLANKNLLLQSAEEGVLKFYVKTTLGNFDTETMKSILANRDREVRCRMYTDGDSSISRADRDLLFKAIFVDESIRVWLFGKFTLQCGEYCEVSAESGFSQPPEMHDCCPNPHLFRHSCMGDNARYANDALANGDYVTAMEQTIGSCASVNINETITSGPWMENLLSEKYGRFFETKDHRRMNITEVLKYLKEEQ